MLLFRYDVLIVQKPKQHWNVHLHLVDPNGHPLPLNRWWGWLFSELFLEEYLIAESAAMVIQTRASAFIVILLYAMSRYEIGELTEL